MWQRCRNTNSAAQVRILTLNFREEIPEEDCILYCVLFSYSFTCPMGRANKASFKAFFLLNMGTFHQNY